MATIPGCARFAAALFAAITAATGAGCASPSSAGEPSPRQQREDAQLAEYEAHAGAPVQQFRLMGTINSWTALGDSAVAVTTSPNRTWLLDLSGPCHELRSAIAIGLTSTNGMVSARFDKVLPRTHNPTGMPCHIQQIRPVDVKALREARRGGGGEAGAPARDQPSGT